MGGEQSPSWDVVNRHHGAPCDGTAKANATTYRSRLSSDQENSPLLRVTDSKPTRRLAGIREEPGILGSDGGAKAS